MKEKKIRYYYYDMMKKRQTFTIRPFTGWVNAGPLNVPGAAFETVESGIWVPIYLLTKETLALLPPHPPLAPEEK